LVGEPHSDRPPTLTEEQRRLAADKQLRVVRDGQRLTVVAPDRRGLLAMIAGVLAANGLAVRSAAGLSEDGMAVDVFDLDLTGPAEPKWARFEADLARALQDPESVEARLAQRSDGGRLPRRPGAARVAPPRVLVDNESTPRATIVEVRCPDGVGVLSRIARSLARCDCNIGTVHALTLGQEVVDTFYVTDVTTGTKVTDSERLGRIESTILGELAALR
jgi:[protein-PII] uridylyltransferase